jgi:hypothetical protein
MRNPGIFFTREGRAKAVATCQCCSCNRVYFGNLQYKSRLFHVSQFDLFTTAATNGKYEGSKLQVDEIK